MDRRHNNGSVKAVSLAIAQRLVHCAVAVSTAVLGHSHKDNVRCTAVEEQLEAKEVQLSQPSSTSMLMISSGLRVQLHLPALDLTRNPVMTHTSGVLKKNRVWLLFFKAWTA